MVKAHFEAMRPWRGVVQEPTGRIGHRLRLVVVIEAGVVVPARVAAHLDQARAEHQAEFEPAQEPHHKHRRFVAAAS